MNGTVEIRIWECFWEFILHLDLDRRYSLLVQLLYCTCGVVFVDPRNYTTKWLEQSYDPRCNSLRLRPSDESSIVSPTTFTRLMKLFHGHFPCFSAIVC